MQLLTTPAHLNLRDRYLPYKKIIAEVILDKNPKIRTVINKVDNVGDESEFRTFGYEVLSGPDDMNVEVKENDCVFQFDYSKVYWNSKLEPEHTRLIKMFQPGEVVADVMAGIGPFAVPAGKKGVFVFANDMNPESFKYLTAAVEKNKVRLSNTLHKVSQLINPSGITIRPTLQHGRPQVHSRGSSRGLRRLNPRRRRHHQTQTVQKQTPKPSP